MQLFTGNSTREYLERKINEVKAEVKSLSNETISSCDIDEWTNYLVDKYRVEPITLFEENISHNLQEATIRRYNPFYSPGNSIFDQQFHYREGYIITFTIPFDGDSCLLYSQPGSRILTDFEISDLNSPTDDNYGDFSIAFSYTKEELNSVGSDLLKFVYSKFENEFGSYRRMIGYVNAEVNTFNVQLSDLIRKQLLLRKEKADSLAKFSTLLEVPLIKSPNAPNAKPIPLKKIAKNPLPKPNKKPAPTVYTISDTDYENINNIIMMTGTTMEKTARTYYRNNEEELRDHLLVPLNTHYDNATGETFRKIGKTDIHIEFENKAAFIGECKIWHGEKALDDAISQLMGYSTWHDLKVSLIIFNKENKNFGAVLDKINSWVADHCNSHQKIKHNHWSCNYYCADKDSIVKINILAFDLRIDETQIQDMRYSR